jgi:uncharacterized protein
MISLKSDIRIDSEGIWFYRNVEMTRRDIIALFYQHLMQDASGRHLIEIGQQRYPVEVEDTAYVVWAMQQAGAEEGINLLLSDYSLESLDPATLRIGKESIPYCKVKNGRLDARFSRSAYYQLAEHIGYDPLRDAYFLSVKGKQYCIKECATL